MDSERLLMRLDAFATMADPPTLRPGRPDRAWIDAFSAHWPYRCLPLTIANTSGWEILCPFGFSAVWNGGPKADDIKIRPDMGVHHPDQFIQSHFTQGVLTFQTGYLFRTPPGYGILASGIPNGMKHGVAPLSGLTETDWLPYPFTMNWRFTAPGRIRFEKDEPFCFISVVDLALPDRIEPIVRPLADDPDLYDQHRVWADSRSEFNASMAAGDAESLKAAWQRFYFNGSPPPGGGKTPLRHIKRRRVIPPASEAKSK